MTHGSHIPYQHIRQHKKKHSFVDSWIYPISLVSPVMTIPQLMDIWIGKKVAGVSLVTWETYTVVGFFWLLYGIYHKEKPIIITNVIFIVLDACIVLGVLLYS